MGLGRGGRRNLSKVVRGQDAGAAPLHLLEVVARPDVAHEQQAFERFHVGARSNHVHGDSNPRVVVVPEGGERGLRVPGTVRDLAAEVVALAELLPQRLDDVVGVTVRLGEDEGLGKLSAAGEDVGPLVAEGSGNRADLVGIDDRPIELGCAVVRSLLLDFPPAGSGLTLAPLDQLLGSHVDKIVDGWLEFDATIATPDLMRSIMPKLGRVLGPRGLMPNAKAGTVTTDISETVQSIKAGQIEYRVERSSGIVHVPIGKVSFEEESLKQNLDAVMSALVAARPSSVKGRYIRSVAISATMGVSVRIDPQQFV